ncbi:hypothetical protein [Rhodococcus baikonurensis]|mgnify:CR=1 FL=1|jgi:hypothetical protein|uniref:Uncharacterized protein n=1 Tax=Rhodococcus baikonurensis TaxID=172041 RepID=A0ABV5XL31_9NOCA
MASRKLKRHSSFRVRNDPLSAQRNAETSAIKPKKSKRELNPGLRAEVQTRLDWAHPGADRRTGW